MNLRISGRQMDIGDAFRTRIETRVGELVVKYFDRGFSGSVTVSKSGSRFSTDCTIHLDSGMSLQVAAEAQEPTLSFDMAMEKFEKRLRRYKRRLKAHGTGANGEATDVAYAVIEPVAEEEEIPEDYAPAIVAESTLALKTMSVASAVIELDAKEAPVLVFRNAGNEQLNIVYRRPDGNIGWIDPSTVRTVRA